MVIDGGEAKSGFYELAPFDLIGGDLLFCFAVVSSEDPFASARVVDFAVRIGIFFEAPIEYGERFAWLKLLRGVALVALVEVE